MYIGIKVQILYIWHSYVRKFYIWKSYICGNPIYVGSPSANPIIYEKILCIWNPTSHTCENPICMKIRSKSRSEARLLVSRSVLHLAPLPLQDVHCPTMQTHSLLNPLCVAKHCSATLLHFHSPTFVVVCNTLATGHACTPQGVHHHPNHHTAMAWGRASDPLQSGR